MWADHAITIMNLNLDFSDDAAELKAMAKVLVDVEDGRGADGVGHGERRRPADELVDEIEQD